MLLACNYYPETEQLVREGKIDIDYFKFPALGFQMGVLNDADAFEEFAARVCAVRPVLLHGLYPEMDRLLRLTGSPGISLHPDECKNRRQIKAATDKLRLLRERYRSLDFISVENMPNQKFGPLIQPEVITEMVERSGCDFLLDISHAYCAARCLGQEVWAYLSKLPLERVYEIHINGWVEKGGDIMCHTKINEAGYSILRELLNLCRPKIITIEYGRPNDRVGCGCPVMRPGEMNRRAMEEIIEQAARIREMI